MNVENETPSSVELLEPPTSTPLSSSEASLHPANSFAQMNIREELQKTLQEMGFTAPLPIQAQTFAAISKGCDLLIQAEQGAGKTAAFGLPLFQNILDLSQNGISEQGVQIQALIVCASRERALKIQKDLFKLGTKLNPAIVALYGGFPMGKQAELLAQGTHIVVGDPKRILDHLHRNQLNLDQLKMLVIDGASELVSEKMWDEVLQIVKLCAPTKQTLVFFQKPQKEITEFSKQLMKEPMQFQFGLPTPVMEREHLYYMVSGMARERDLVRVLDIHQPKAALIFCNTPEEVHSVTQYLYNQGLEVKGLNHALHGADLEKCNQMIRTGQIKYVVTTEYCAKGIGGKEITHLIHFTFPETPEIYLARMDFLTGKAGVLISLIGPREIGNFYTFKLTSPLRPVEQSFPPAEELLVKREEQYFHRLEKELLRTPPTLFYQLVRRVQALPDGERFLAILLERYLTTPRSTEGPFFASQKSESTEHRSFQSPSESGRRDSTANDKRPGRDPKRERSTARDTRGPKEHSDRKGYVADRNSNHPEKNQESSVKTSKPETTPKAEGTSAKTSKKRPARATEGKGRKPNESVNTARSSATKEEPVSQEPIEMQEGREYWEAWVDSKQPTLSPEETSSESSLETPKDMASSQPKSSLPKPEGESLVEQVSETNEDKAEPESTMPKLYLNVGKRHGVNQARLHAFLVEKGLPEYPVQIRFTHSYLLPPEEKMDEVIASLQGAVYRNRTLLCERARK